MKALVGYTGFVGSNLFATGAFERGYNSKNIEESYGTRPELLVYAGVRAEKFLANRAPEADLAQVRRAMENIRRIAPRKLVLISTVDVLGETAGKDEDSPLEPDTLQPYGANRCALEGWVRAYAPDALIVRLPALFGRGLKKNFLYDYLHPVPGLLSGAKLEELAARAPGLQGYYLPQDNGFYRRRPLGPGEEEGLKRLLDSAGFSALHFTDSRSRFQFYPLKRLWGDIGRCLEEDIPLFHPATQPLEAAQLYRALCGGSFENRLPGQPARYDYRSKYAALFGGAGEYIMDKNAVVLAVKEFVEGYEE